MKILVLKGSPHKKGTSNTLADEFIKGAKDAGHSVYVYDCAHGNIHPCNGCDHCGMNGDCIQKDDGNKVIEKLLESDVVVFATPVYYFGMSAQLKMIIDRFYARNGAVTGKKMGAVLIATAWNNDSVVMKGIKTHFDIIFDYLDFKNRGMILAKGAGTVGMMPDHYLSEIKRVNEILGAEGLKISAVQNHYSLLNRSSETSGILKYCNENNITFYAYMVLEQGALTGKYDTNHPFPQGSDRANAYGSVMGEIEKLVNVMKVTGEKYNATPAQMATAWAIAKGTLPIIGVTKTSHITDALKAENINISDEDIEKMESAADSISVSTIRYWERKME